MVYFLYTPHNCFLHKNTSEDKDCLSGKEPTMAKEEKYLLVDERVVPDIFKKVLEAKKYLATGKKFLGSGAACQYFPQCFL